MFMNSKKIFTFIFVSLLLFILCACSSEEKKVFEDEVPGSYTFSTMGIDGSVELTGDSGVVKSSGAEIDFTYRIKDITDDGKQATIVVEGTGIPEIDGQEVRATLLDNGLKLAYQGIAVDLKKSQDPRA